MKGSLVANRENSPFDCGVKLSRSLAERGRTGAIVSSLDSVSLVNGHQYTGETVVNHGSFIQQRRSGGKVGIDREV